MITLAMVWESVWALMTGLIVQHILQIGRCHMWCCRGTPNRLQMERAALVEQFHFGKYLFVSSSTSFLIENGDRIILSKFLSLASLGFYNIAFFFGSVPLMLMGQLCHEGDLSALQCLSARGVGGQPAGPVAHTFCPDRQHVRDHVRPGASGTATGRPALYAEYSDVGVLLVGISLSLMPSLIIRTHAFAILASGKSSVFTAFQLFRGALQTGLLLIGVINFGILGALVAQPLAALLSYPVLYYILRPYRAQDPLHDAVFFGLTALCAAIVFWVNGDVLVKLAEMS